MKETVVVLSSKEDQITELSGALEAEDYRVVPLWSTETLEVLLAEYSCRVVILDVDTIDVDNRFFRELNKRNPGVHVIVISVRPFHPELREAILSHIDACLSKPINTDELLYWLKSTFHDHAAREPDPVRNARKNPRAMQQVANCSTQGDEEMPQ
jgi:DNA-binding NtrC family response regulator